jgi:potassium/hydrogen antiporter
VYFIALQNNLASCRIFAALCIKQHNQAQAEIPGQVVDNIYLLTLLGTGLVLLAAFSSLIAFRFGAPLLLLFLVIGLVTGTDGLGIEFNNTEAAYFVGCIALALILFDSGFGTPVHALRQAAAPALALATVGVLITASIMAVAAHFLMGFGWLEAFLLGAIAGSTDAAAVFFLLRAGNTEIKERIRSTLEIESGSNDPIAIFLTISLVEILSSGHSISLGALTGQVAAGFLSEMIVGAMIGLGGGYIIVRLVEKLDIDRGLLPILVLALSLMVYGLAGFLGGSGFLAVYLAGLVAGNANLRSQAAIKRFQEGLSWLSQIIMFLVLGLYATPSEFMSVLVPAIILAFILIFVARPIAVSLSLFPFKFANAETAFLSWVGLRGAVSILLALTPILGGLEQGRQIFNVAFIIVMVSLIVQGWTVLPLARRLGLVVPPRIGPVDKVELELPGAAHHELLAYRIVEGSPVARTGRIPRWARPSLVVRDGRSLQFQYAGRPRAGDHVYIFVSDKYPRLLDRLFASKAAVAADDADFFGAFGVDPTRLASELALAYGVAVSEAESKVTIAQFMTERLGGRVEYADRLPLGDIELIVRDLDEQGHILEVGVSVEPQLAQPHIPTFLSVSLMLVKVRKWAAQMRTKLRLRS